MPGFSHLEQIRETVATKQTKGVKVYAQKKTWGHNFEQGCCKLSVQSPDLAPAPATRTTRVDGLPLGIQLAGVGD